MLIRGILRAALSFGLYPMLTAGGLAGAIFMLEAGVPLSLTVVLVTLPAAVLVFAFEYWMPFYPEWKHTKHDRIVDILHTIASNAMTEGVRVAMLGPLVALSGWISNRIGLGLWPKDLPLSAELLLAFLIAEFGGYWGHRLLHSNSILFRLHATHHSATRLYFLAGGRTHALEALLVALLSIAPLLFLGVSERVLGLLGTLAGIHYMLQHSNIDIRMGKIGWLINGPEMHRWHHSRKLEEANSNYAGMLLLWDWVFGSFFRPPAAKAPPKDVGLFGLPRFPGDFIGQIVSPFRRAIWKEPGSSN